MAMANTADSIYALSTPPGKSGVAVVRASGAQVKTCMQALGVTPLPPARMATLAALRAADGAPIDRALVLYFPAPASFTGEDVAEFHVHGGRSVIRALMAEIGAVSGMRLAEPGEFMRRAFMNGKFDLTAAEGLADLIDAETETQRRQALRLMQGDAAEFFNALRSGIIHVLAYLEAYIDFPDEDIPGHVLEEIHRELVTLSERIAGELAKAEVGKSIREGIRVVIVGPPNAGKSSLLNAIARREIAIVSEQAGTTRDVLEAHLDLHGYSVTFVDTAGIRALSGDQDNSIEQEGIRRSFREASHADIKILLLDASQNQDFLQAEPSLELFDNRTVRVFNKADLATTRPSPGLCISVLRGEGIDTLLEVILQRIETFFPSEPVFVTRARHQQHLGNALEYIHKYLSSPTLPLELQCEELRSAAAEIGKITGAIAVDELLGHIFSSFCIGK